MNATQEAIFEILHEGPATIPEMEARMHRTKAVIHHALKQMAKADKVRVQGTVITPKGQVANLWEAVE